MATRKDREREKARRTSARDWAGKQDQSGGSTCVKLPEGVEFYKLEVGTHKLDFLPFITGKNNPRADEGMEHFERTYEAHRIATPDGHRLYACRKSCFGKRCAVCDWLVKNGGTADQELVKDMRAKTRHLWLVNAKPGETKKPVVKVLDTGHFNRGMGFGELMVDAINSLDEGVDPFVLENGYTATLTVKEQVMPRGKYNAVTRIDLRPHSYDYPSDLLDKLPCLDDMLVDVGYDDLRKLLDPESAQDDDRNGDDDHDAPVSHRKPAAKDDDDDDDDNTPAQRKGGKAKPDDDDDDTPAKGKTAKELGLKVGDYVDHPEHGECKIIRISGDGTSLKLEDEDDEVHSAISPESVTKVKLADDKDDDDDDDDTPAARRGGKTKPDDDDDDDGDDQDDDDDEPRIRQPKGQRNSRSA